ncbi:MULTISPECIES: hypothetical protein [Photobacterium]|nr:MULTISPECIES: hypothetical protein [Photobacterium]MDO6581776.1 hypothetical protein [Photobacterium sp. 2_MG-2023]
MLFPLAVGCIQPMESGVGWQEKAAVESSRSKVIIFLDAARTTRQ